MASIVTRYADQWLKGPTLFEFWSNAWLRHGTPETGLQRLQQRKIVVVRLAMHALPIIRIDDQDDLIGTRRAVIVLSPKHDNSIFSFSPRGRSMDGRDELFSRDVAELDQSWVEPRL